MISVGWEIERGKQKVKGLGEQGYGGMGDLGTKGVREM